MVVATKTLIQLEQVSKTYHLGSHEVHALRETGLVIQEGEFVAIMGPSGSGKSTLMHLLGLLDRPDHGDYVLDGQRVSTFGPDELSRLRNESIGFVFQQFNLLSRTTATDNVTLPLLYSHRRFGPGHVKDLLSRVGLAERAHHKPNEMSGGQQQRVAIARALVNGPKLILADEPTGNLDTQSANEIMSILRGLNERGMTVVLVTHEADIASQARRIITMRDGRIQSDEKTSSEPVHAPAPETPAATRRFQNLRAILSYFTLAFRALAAHKVRALLSMLGILIGVSAVVAVMALGAGAREAVKEQFSALGSNLLMIRPGVMQGGGIARKSGLVSRMTLDDMNAVESDVPAVVRTAATVSGRYQVDYGNKNWQTEVQGVTPKYAPMHAMDPKTGRFINDDDVMRRARVAVLGATVVRELFGEKSPLGEYVKINRVIFQIVGVLPSKGASPFRDRDDTILIPLSTAMYRLMGQDYLGSIEAEIAPQTDMDQAQDDITTLLKRRHRIPESETDAYYVRNMAEIRDAMAATSKTMGTLLSAIAAISLIVGGIGIMNIMLVSVTERVKEIGLRIAVGARYRDILGQFLVEAVAVSVTGGLIGIALGVGISQVLAHGAGWTILVSPRSVGLAFGCSAAIGLIFGIWPARRAAQMNPIEALRYE